MGVGEIITIVVVGAVAAGIIAWLVYKKVKGESVGCDCGSCNGCPHCNACKSKTKNPVKGDKKQ